MTEYWMASHNIPEK